MAKKNEKLTQKQERELVEFRERMWAQGTSCEPCNRAEAEAAISDAYREIGRKPPIFFWMSSPMTCALGLHVLQRLAEHQPRLAGLGDGLGDGLRDGLWDGLGAGLRAGLGVGLRDGLGDGLWDGLGAGLGDGLGDGLRDRLGAGWGAGLWAGLGDGLGDLAYTYWWGQMDTYWLAYYRFGSDLGCAQKADLLRRLSIMERIAASCGFWYPRDGVCLVSDRFLSVKWDESRNRAGLPFRLHNADGPAVQFRDQWGLFYWHGYRIPDDHSWIITDKARITADAIMSEPNAELRRVMCEVTEFEPIRTIGKVISEDADGNGHPRRLLTANIKGDEIRIVEVQNGSLEPDGSRRKFLLGAMPGATPHQVIAASYGINPELYVEAVRT